MEMNETSAQRVADVYSELAAISASDTQELADAMSRVASLAHSTGAEFENVAAFLAQGIETTREPAENIGTALKTVLARMQEVKKNPNAITEVEGEELNANKVEEAIRSAGIATRDANGEFRAADQILLELSEKWDTLDGMTRRYIATQAAGSRRVDSCPLQPAA